MQFFRFLIVPLLAFIFFSAPVISFAQFDDGLSQVADGTGGGYNTASTLPGMIGLLIQAFLGILGVIFLGLTLYSGFLWMTAQGDDGKVKLAKDTLVRAVIGIVIVLSAYSIVDFVLIDLIQPATTGVSG